VSDAQRPAHPAGASTADIDKLKTPFVGIETLSTSGGRTGCASKASRAARNTGDFNHDEPGEDERRLAARL
jgi:hypothetical protein